jgi:hypothetical protein
MPNLTGNLQAAKCFLQFRVMGNNEMVLSWEDEVETTTSSM